MTSRPRPLGRAADALRPLELATGVLKFAEGSAEVRLGDTRVLVAATVERRVPPFLFDKGKGWVTAEYSMLPRATATRSPREVQRGRPSGRTSEIQRLIGRSLRAAVDLKALADCTVTLDCDVLQADGGTRTASITAAWVAMTEALAAAFLAGDLGSWPVVDQVAAISVGLLGGQALLDLEYVEDAAAEVDLNVVGTAAGQLIEVQGTGEERPFGRAELDALLDLGFAGLEPLFAAQRDAVAGPLAAVREARERRRRPAATPKPERDLWGPPD